jgi:hypothetical protein
LILTEFVVILCRQVMSLTEKLQEKETTTEGSAGAAVDVPGLP